MLGLRTRGFAYHAPCQRQQSGTHFQVRVLQSIQIDFEPQGFLLKGKRYCPAGVEKIRRFANGENASSANSVENFLIAFGITAADKQDLTRG